MESKFSKLIYDLHLRVRIMQTALQSDKPIGDLSDREILLIELLGSKKDMSVSEVCKLHPQVSASTISTTISKLCHQKGLISKTILPENQRVTIVNLTPEGESVLEEIKTLHTAMYSTIEKSLGLTVEEENLLSEKIEKGIDFFNKRLDVS